MFDFNILKNLIIPEEFGTNDYSEATAEIENVINQLPRNAGTAWGATQFVIFVPNENKVAKIPFTGEFFRISDDDEEDEFGFSHFSTNYCDLSYDLYLKAIEWDVVDILAQTEYFGVTKDGSKIYLQEKINEYYDCNYNNKNVISEDSKKAYNRLENNNHLFPKDWILAAIEFYGIEMIKNFLTFCDENGLDDFHDGNFGWRDDGSPCVLDWAGYYEY